jgi:hypothetical protein
MLIYRWSTQLDVRTLGKILHFLMHDNTLLAKARSVLSYQLDRTGEFLPLLKSCVNALAPALLCLKKFFSQLSSAQLATQRLYKYMWSCLEFSGDCWKSLVCGASGRWDVLGASERCYREQQLRIRSYRGKAGIKATLMPGWKLHLCLTNEPQTCISLLIWFETDEALVASNIRGAENAKKHIRASTPNWTTQVAQHFCQALSHGKYGLVRLLHCLAPFPH